MVRKRNVRHAVPTVIIQQPSSQPAQIVEVIERQPQMDQGAIMMQLAQLVAQQQSKAPEAPQTFTVKEAAEYLRCSTWTIYDLCRTDSIPYFKVKSRYFFRRHELDKWISGNTNACHV
ncbi:MULTISPECIES: helix-turn-helix domain-containing protein [Paenibacillus]|nr:helix-turn-helix domain-containing protein [Paenibacillus rhizosphaerae]